MSSYTKMMYNWHCNPYYNMLRKNADYLTWKMSPKEYGQTLLNRKRGKK